MARTNRDRTPTTEALESELRRVRYRSRYGRLLRSTVSALLVAAAAAALLATLLLPVLQITGSSMAPLLREGDIVLSVKTRQLRRGDVVSFYHGNKILVKRVVGLPLDEIELDEAGNVYVNGILLDEPYLSGRSRGECDVEFPLTVPEGAYFVLGDSRETSIDSRTAAVGCVNADAVVGKIICTVWPVRRIGAV